MIHVRRHFCELINYAIYKDGDPIADMVKNNWEQDIKDSRELIDAITNCFNVYNEQVRKCIGNPKQGIVKLKNKHVKPLINASFDMAKAIFKDIERVRVTALIKIRLSLKENGLKDCIKLLFTSLITKID